MKILFDNQCFFLHGKGGISRYISELIFELRKRDNITIFFQGHKVYDFFIDDSNLTEFTFKGINRLNLEYEKRKNFNFVKNHIEDCDFYFPTFYHPAFARFLDSSNNIVLIHDMIHELLPRQCQNAELFSNWKKTYIKKAKLLAAVSKNTANDLMSTYNINKTVEILYPGTYFHKNNSTLKSEKDYFLYVGPRNDYKNFTMLLESMVELKKRDHLIKLKLVGGKSFSDQEKEYIKEHKLLNQIQHVVCNNSELQVLYQNAIAFVSTSKYEGFGLPLLEAMASKCPLFIYDSEIYREVGDSNSYFFSTKEQLSQILGLDKQSIKKPSNPYKFSWKKSADKLVLLLK